MDAQGRPQANPVGRFLRDDGTVDIAGRAMGATRKWRNVGGNRYVSLVVDDVVSANPWTVRGVEIRGEAEQVVGPHELGAHLSEELIRIRPYHVISWARSAGTPDRPGRVRADQHEPFPPRTTPPKRTSSSSRPNGTLVPPEATRGHRSANRPSPQPRESARDWRKVVPR